jgi:hypothetical protein
MFGYAELGREGRREWGIDRLLTDPIFLDSIPDPDPF